MGAKGNRRARAIHTVLVMTMPPQRRDAVEAWVVSAMSRQRVLVLAWYERPGRWQLFDSMPYEVGVEVGNRWSC